MFNELAPKKIQVHFLRFLVSFRRKKMFMFFSLISHCTPLAHFRPKSVFTVTDQNLRFDRMRRHEPDFK